MCANCHGTGRCLRPPDWRCMMECQFCKGSGVLRESASGKGDSSDDAAGISNVTAIEKVPCFACGGNGNKDGKPAEMCTTECGRCEGLGYTEEDQK